MGGRLVVRFPLCVRASERGAVMCGGVFCLVMWAARRRERSCGWGVLLVYPPPRGCGLCVCSGCVLTSVRGSFISPAEWSESSSREREARRLPERRLNGDEERE